MLNDGWDEGMTRAEIDDAAEEMYRDAHPCCLECEAIGCIADACPSGSCDVEPLVMHDGELMHEHCKAPWNQRIENKEAIQ